VIGCRPKRDAHGLDAFQRDREGRAWHNSDATALGMVGETRSKAAPNIPTIAEQGYPGVTVVNVNVGYTFRSGLWHGRGKDTKIGIGIGNQPKPKPLPEPVEDDQVCFYRNANFNGPSFCVEPGDSDNELSGSWDDSISSIEVFGNADVLVCRDYDLEGICADISSSKASLPNQLNNNISSYEVN